MTSANNLYLKTGNGGIPGGTRRLTILANGDVGIGTESPTNLRPIEFPH